MVVGCQGIRRVGAPAVTTIYLKFAKKAKNPNPLIFANGNAADPIEGGACKFPSEQPSKPDLTRAAGRLGHAPDSLLSEASPARGAPEKFAL